MIRSSAGKRAKVERSILAVVCWWLQALIAEFAIVGEGVVVSEREKRLRMRHEAVFVNVRAGYMQYYEVRLQPASFICR